MNNFEIAVKIDKLNDRLDKAKKIISDASAELSKLVDELNEEE